jgi:hypothetical protein
MPEYQWITDRIFTVANFFSQAECQEAIRRAEAIGFDAAPINTAFGPQIRSDVRNNSRVMVDDHELASALWERCRDYLPLRLPDGRAVGINERFRYYRYDVGQQFDWHFDGAFERASGERSRLTFMIYLNAGFRGGETTFEDAEIVPAEGLALFFWHAIRHKGQPVTHGRKYVLRTDVMYRKGK